jgi:three-Cys-motif partner protein
MAHLLGGDGLPVRESGIWAKEKLHYLEHYLNIFFTGMRKKWPGKLYYVDLFSGPGRCYIRETREEVDGSPLIALRFSFEKYFFFEMDPDCHRALNTRIKTRAPEKAKNITTIMGDCNDKIGDVKPPSSPALGLAFIDPTGISQISFETIRKLTTNRKIDLLINFPEGMGIRMNLHQYTKKETSALNSFIGTNRWQQRFQETIMSFPQACSEIANEYLENLRSIGYQITDGSQIPVMTNQNRLLYYLLFASKDPKGNEFWKKIGIINPHGQRKLFP